jgi:hypothetical protein
MRSSAGRFGAGDAGKRWRERHEAGTKLAGLILMKHI